jgi:hypothetical protein
MANLGKMKKQKKRNRFIYIYNEIAYVGEHMEFVPSSGKIVGEHMEFVPSSGKIKGNFAQPEKEKEAEAKKQEKKKLMDNIEVLKGEIKDIRKDLIVTAIIAAALWGATITGFLYLTGNLAYVLIPLVIAAAYFTVPLKLSKNHSVMNNFSDLMGAKSEVSSMMAEVSKQG